MLETCGLVLTWLRSRAQSSRATGSSSCGSARGCKLALGSTSFGRKRGGGGGEVAWGYQAGHHLSVRRSNIYASNLQVRAHLTRAQLQALAHLGRLQGIQSLNSP